MTITILKPKNEKEFVNLYATVVEAIKKSDDEFLDALTEANILDDAEIEEIIDMLNDYYTDMRNKTLKIKSDTEDIWILELVNNLSL